MKQIDINIPLISAKYRELDATQRDLVDKARAMTRHSYAPYSKFHVGAAILLDNGEIITGSNQENVAYPSGICAERTAAFYAHSRYPEAKFKAIAIAARDTSGHEVATPISPCGACRQVLLEYEQLAGTDAQVLLAGAEDIYIIPSIQTLRHRAFVDFD